MTYRPVLRPTPVEALGATFYLDPPDEAWKLLTGLIKAVGTDEVDDIDVAALAFDSLAELSEFVHVAVIRWEGVEQQVDGMWVPLEWSTEALQSLEPFDKLQIVLEYMTQLELYSGKEPLPVETDTTDPPPAQ